MRLGEREVSDIPAISTTSLSIDAATGVGGVPRGRIIEIFGPESSGKTTLALHIVAEAQKAGGVAAYIDAEHAMDSEYAGKLGVNIDDLLISQPDSGEQGLEIAEALVRSNGVDVIVIDSVAALVPRAELDGDMGDSLPGLQARLMSQALRKLTAVSLRQHVPDFHQPDSREDRRSCSVRRDHDGRAALKSILPCARHSSLWRDQGCRARRRQRTKGRRQEQGAPPFRECEFDIMYAKASRARACPDLGVAHKIVERVANGSRIRTSVSQGGKPSRR